MATAPYFRFNRADTRVEIGPNLLIEGTITATVASTAAPVSLATASPAPVVAITRDIAEGGGLWANVNAIARAGGTDLAHFALQGRAWRTGAVTVTVDSRTAAAVALAAGTLTLTARAGGVDISVGGVAASWVVSAEFLQL